MKKTLPLMLFLSLVTSVVFAGNGYKLNNQQVDALFNDAVEVDMVQALETNNVLGAIPYEITQDDYTTKVLVSCILHFTGLNLFGVHRYILGTKPNMWAMYTLTVCGIFGIVPLVDFWVLLIDGLILQNPGRYIDNEEFMMWLN